MSRRVVAVGGDELVISSITIVEGDSGEVRTRQGSRAESPVTRDHTCSDQIPRGERPNSAW